MRAEDYAEIQQLLARYCHIVDSKSWDHLADVFTGDASMSVAGIHDAHTGLDALRELYGVKMNHPLAHNSTCVVVAEESESEARLVSKWITIRVDGQAGAGVYEDHVVRTDDGWRIRRRMATPLSPVPKSKHR